MHVEVDDGYALRPMRRHCVARRHGDVIDKAKSHGNVAGGVVSRRTRGDKGGVGGSAHDLVDGGHRSASSVKRRLHRRRTHCDVRAYWDEPVFGGGPPKHFQMGFRMHAQQRFTRDDGRFGPRERLEPFVFQASFDGAQAVRLFRVSPAHFMR